MNRLNRTAISRGCTALLTLVLLTAQYTAAQQQGGKPPSPAAIQFFESRVRPVLAENCYRCHGAEKQKGTCGSIRWRPSCRAAIKALPSSRRSGQEPAHEGHQLQGR